jgi:hypothetical protein
MLVAANLENAYTNKKMHTPKEKYLDEMMS